MASEVDICNLALSHIAKDATVSSIDPPDNTVAAEHCARFYPIARDATLELHAWAFATKRKVLAQTPNEVSHWLFSYTLPTDCIRPLVVLPPESTDDNANAQDFTVEVNSSGVKVVYTNQQDAVLKYIAKVTDTTKFSPLFVAAVAHLLASYLAGPLTKDERRVAAQLELYEKLFKPRAIGSDASGQRNNAYKDSFIPAHIRARS